MSVADAYMLPWWNQAHSDYLLSSLSFAPNERLKLSVFKVTSEQYDRYHSDVTKLKRIGKLHVYVIGILVTFLSKGSEYLNH